MFDYSKIENVTCNSLIGHTQLNTKVMLFSIAEDLREIKYGIGFSTLDLDAERNKMVDSFLFLQAIL